MGETEAVVEAQRSHHDARRIEGLLSRELGGREKELIEDALAFTRGNQLRACDVLGCNKVYLWARLKVHGVDPKDVKARAEAGWVYRTAPVGAPWVTAEF